MLRQRKLPLDCGAQSESRFDRSRRYRRENMATVDPSLVAHLPLFAGLSPDELGEILREARSARLAKNSAVFE